MSLHHLYSCSMMCEDACFLCRGCGMIKQTGRRGRRPLQGGVRTAGDHKGRPYETAGAS